MISEKFFNQLRINFVQYLNLIQNLLKYKTIAKVNLYKTDKMFSY
jgi:hypothetical protein